MAIDLNALRAKLAKLNGEGGDRQKKPSKFFVPEPGVYKARLMHWPDHDPSQPFKEIRTYYLGEVAKFPAPSQFGLEDPVNDFIKKLLASKDPDDKSLAKLLFPKSRNYGLIYVRSKSTNGIDWEKYPIESPLAWNFGKEVHSRLIEFFFDDEYGGKFDDADYMNPDRGLDIKITIKKVPKRKYNMTTVDCMTTVSKLHEDPSVVKRILDERFSVKDLYKIPDAEEIRSKLALWLESKPLEAEQKRKSEAGFDDGGEDEKPAKVAQVEAVEQVEKSKEVSPAPKKSRKSLDDVIREMEG